MASASTPYIPGQLNDPGETEILSAPLESETSIRDSSPHTLTKAVFARRSEYTLPRHIRIKVGSWNVAALKGTEKDVGGWFIDGRGVEEALTGLSCNQDGAASSTKIPPVPAPSAGNAVRESVDDQESRYERKKETLPMRDHSSLPGGSDVALYVLGLQEIVDIASPSEALRPYIDPAPSQKWKTAMSEALPAGYELVAEQQQVGLYIMIYASRYIKPSISSVSVAHVGTGLMGYMGNKGAVAVRLLLGETTRLVFVNCHLAAGTDRANLDRRNWDAGQIAQRLKFEPADDGSGVFDGSAEMLGDEDVAWWFGDLNYRLDGLPGDDVRRLLMLHTRNEYDIGQNRESKMEKELSQEVGSISLEDRESKVHDSDVVGDPRDDIKADLATNDPASIQMTLSSLLSHDQLRQQQKARNAFHEGWCEGPITFMPTYKYDVGSFGMFDSSEKKRSPSWCDRILYRTRKDRIEYDKQQREEDEARRRDEEMKQRGMEDAAAEDDVLFDYDPETDGAEETDAAKDTDPATDEGEQVPETSADLHESLKLHYYVSHQRVLSSDHKPLDAIFMLSYDSVVPELKAKVQQEVARELDKAENERRPTVTVAIDHHRHRYFTGRSSDIAADTEDPSDADGIDFGELAYTQEKTQNFTVANTGQVSAKLQLVDRPRDEEHSAASSAIRWLDVRFERADEENPSPGPTQPGEDQTLEPGDTVNVIITAKVHDIDRVRALNDGSESLDDVLILRVEGGRDHFILIRGQWLQSCFGRSVDELTRFPEHGARALISSPQPSSSSPPSSSTDRVPLSEQSVKWSAPREIFRLTESIEELVERVVAEWGMTTMSDPKENTPPWESFPGWPFTPESHSEHGPSPQERDTLRLAVHEALDTSSTPQTHLPPETPPLVRLELLAQTLLDFLASLKDGIIPAEIWTQLIPAIPDIKSIITTTNTTSSSSSSTTHSRSRSRSNTANDLLDDQRTRILDVLSATSPPHNIAFVFLTSMLARIAAEIAPLPSSSSTGGGSGGGGTSFTDEQSPTSSPTRRSSSARNVDPATMRRQRTEAALAHVFAGVMIRAPWPAKEKERRAEEERREAVVRVFIVQGQVESR
ncbi:MAG: hypothetical protein M1825_001028 [Sarcosagium campestre]|nr:MAG: hypothetical protein M1825_001028 [Sarcosagium campestre]